MIPFWKMLCYFFRSHPLLRLDNYNLHSGSCILTPTLKPFFFLNFWTTHIHLFYFFSFNHQFLLNNLILAEIKLQWQCSLYCSFKLQLFCNTVVPQVLLRNLCHIHATRKGRKFWIFIYTMMKQNPGKLLQFKIWIFAIFIFRETDSEIL